MHKDLALMHCSMFKLTHPSSLPGRKRHTQLGIVWKGACHLASLRLSHTHMHTLLGQSGIAPNNGRLGFVFPWQSAPAIFPRWQRNQTLSVARNHVCEGMCVCVCVCAYRERYLVQWRAQMFRHSLGWILSWPLGTCPRLCTHWRTRKTDLQSLEEVGFMSLCLSFDLTFLIVVSRFSWCHDLIIIIKKKKPLQNLCQKSHFQKTIFSSCVVGKSLWCNSHSGVLIISWI